MSNTQGSHNFNPVFPEYASGPEYPAAGPATPACGTGPTDPFVPTSYPPNPGPFDSLPHYGSPGLQVHGVSEERVMMEPINYPESSQRADNHATFTSPSYILPREAHFDAMQATSTRHADLTFSVIPTSPLSARAPPLQLDRYLNSANATDTPSLHHGDVLNPNSSPQFTSYVEAGGSFYPNQGGTSGLSNSPSRKRGPPDQEEFDYQIQSPFRVKLEDSVGGAYHLPSPDVAPHAVNAVPVAHNASLSSIPIGNQGWSPTYSEDDLSLQGLNISSGSPPPPPSAPSSFHPVRVPPTTRRKKKPKMHTCEICAKSFPRPSGLRTHMNTHNNVKPYHCWFPGCNRKFAVRSNARRHFRTHTRADAASQTSMVATPSSSHHGGTLFNLSAVSPQILAISPDIPNSPMRLRWMPPSLLNRNNADSLTTVSDDDSDDDPHENEEGNADWAFNVPIPLPPANPSLPTDSHGVEEERNSFIDAPPYPYHPSQFRVLPGPALVPCVITH